MRKLLATLTNLTLLRYVAASAIALGADFGSFLAFLSLGAPAAPASAAGYALGVVVHWLISSRAVFADSVSREGPARTRQKAMFVLSALFGLALTTAIVGAGTAMGLDPRIAKIGAVLASFTLTWLLRSRIIFAAGETA